MKFWILWNEVQMDHRIPLAFFARKPSWNEIMEVPGIDIPEDAAKFLVQKNCYGVMYGDIYFLTEEEMVMN